MTSGTAYEIGCFCHVARRYRAKNANKYRLVSRRDLLFWREQLPYNYFTIVIEKARYCELPTARRETASENCACENYQVPFFLRKRAQISLSNDETTSHYRPDLYYVLLLSSTRRGKFLANCDLNLALFPSSRDATFEGTSSCKSRPKKKSSPSAGVYMQKGRRQGRSGGSIQVTYGGLHTFANRCARARASVLSRQKESIRGVSD